MTSQKSLKNNVNGNDFKRSFIGSIVFPAIAFFVLFFFMTVPIINYVTSEEFFSTREHLEVSMFLARGSLFNTIFELVPIGMILCGMLTAFKSFSYLLSKKQVNVFLSLGIRRNTMLTNRMLSGIICLFIAVFVPMFIIYIVNITSFGISAHVTEVFLYITSLLFVSGLVGYAVVAAMIMVSGNPIEVVFTSLALTLMPYITILFGSRWFEGYLKGFVVTDYNTRWMSLFTPWAMSENIHQDYIGDGLPYYDGNSVTYGSRSPVGPEQILRVLTRDTSIEKFKVPDALQVDIGFTLAIIIWFVVSLLLIGVAYALYNHRKAEHANSLGKFPISRAIVCTVAYVGIAFVAVENAWGKISWSALFIIIAVSAAVAYFLIQLIFTRKVKTALKSFSWYGVLTVALAVCAVSIGTGFFGTFNKIPDVKDVKSVSISVDEHRMFSNYISLNSDNVGHIECTSDEGKKAVFEAYELLKHEKYEYGKPFITRINIVIQDNDGKSKYREFAIYDEATYVKFLEIIYESDFFDTILKDVLATDILDAMRHEYSLREYIWAFTDNELYESNEELNVIDDAYALCDALYKDLSAMTFDQFFKQTSKPLGILVRKNDVQAENEYVGEEYVDKEFAIENGIEESEFPTIPPEYSDDLYFPIDTEYGICNSDSDRKFVNDKSVYGIFVDFIPVYPEMKNTVKLLEEMGYEFVSENLHVKEVLYTDSSLSFDMAMLQWAEARQDVYTGWGTYTDAIFEYKMMTFTAGYFLDQSPYNISYFLDGKVTLYDLLKDVYDGAGHPLTSVTDKAEMEKIMDKTVYTQHLLVGDSGRYVYVVYEEGPMVCYYIPEANVSVVK